MTPPGLSEEHTLVEFEQGSVWSKFLQSIGDQLQAGLREGKRQVDDLQDPRTAVDVRLPQPLKAFVEVPSRQEDLFFDRVVLRLREQQFGSVKHGADASTPLVARCLLVHCGGDASLGNVVRCT